MIKIFDYDGNDIFTDSIGPSYFSRMHSMMDVEAVNDGFVIATLKGFKDLSILHMDNGFEITSLVDVEYTNGPAYAGFVSNDSTIQYVHNYHEAYETINGDTLYNQKSNVGWNGYQQATLVLSYEPMVLRTQEVPEHAIKLYPNPVRSVLNLNVSPEDIGRDFNIYSSTGQLVFSGSLRHLTEQVDLSQLSTGLYVITCDRWTRRFIKE